MNGAIVVAGGCGERFGRAGGKQLAPLLGMPLVSWSVKALAESGMADVIVVVADPARTAEFERVLTGLPVDAVVAGGATRQLSVAAGLAAIPEDADTVAVHDGARPLVTPEAITSAFEALDAHPGVTGVVVGHPVTDTVKRVDGAPNAMVTGTPPRETLWVAQTPQVFRASALREAYARAEAEGLQGTDDASLVEHAGGRVMLVRSAGANIKVTTPDDLTIAECLLRARLGAEKSDG